MAWAGLESKQMGQGTTEKKEARSRTCPLNGQRLCEDGTCVPRTELCPEEELVSQETILVMIGVAMAIFLLLIFLYCIQQRRSGNTDQQADEGGDGDEPNHPELLLIPPPAYDEAVDVALYPPTPQIERLLSSTSEEPTTPPPNYDTALHILAQSEENLLVSREMVSESPTLRRAVSADFLGINRCRPMTFSSFGANAKTFSKKPPNENQSQA